MSGLASPDSTMTAEEQVAALREELETVRRKLAETYKMASVGKLLAGVVHEINTPIGSVRSNNEVLARSLEKIAGILECCPGAGEAALAKARSLLDSCRNLTSVDRIACDRISSVIRNLKTFARADRSELRKVRLAELIENALKLTQCEFRRRITVESDFGEMPEIECNPDSLSQVFLNLLINAGQAIEGEGKITIRTRVEDGEAVISISDTGSGIAPEHLPEIFRSGFTTKPAGVGTGLGLAITRQIVVEDHHGSIDVQSELGAGTTFHLRLPLRQPDEPR